jgi:UDP-glucose 4-epimerase
MSQAVVGEANERHGGRVMVVGGARFVGSHLVSALLAEASTERVTVFDNFSSGRAWHLQEHRDDDRLAVVTGDVKDLDQLGAAMGGQTS